MSTLIKYLPIIIGDEIPECNRHWNLFIVFRKMYDIVMSPRTTEAEAYTLQELVEKHNRLYYEFYGSLKPKMHFFTHYSRLLLLLGPLIHFWGMPHERKNHMLKEIADGTNSHKNIPLTIAITNQIQLCHVKEFLSSVELDFEPGPIFKDQVDDEIKSLNGNIKGVLNSKILKFVNILGKKV